MRLHFSISKFALTSIMIMGTSLFAMGNDNVKEVESAAKAPYADTLVTSGPTPESVMVKGIFDVEINVSLPKTPCSVATPCANVPVSLEAKLENATGTGATTGKKYTVDGDDETHGKFTMPGGVAMMVKVGLKRGNAAKGWATVKIFVIVDETGKVTNVSVPPSGLVSWWRGDGDAKDAQGTNPGTTHGTVNFVAGNSGQAFSFDPAAYIEVAPSASLRPAKVTASAWVRSSTPPPGLPPLSSRFVLSQGAQLCDAASYSFTNGLTGNLKFFIFNGTTPAVSSPDAPAIIWDGNWHFVVGTYDGAFVRLYVDGTAVGTGTPSTIAINYALSDGQKFNSGAYGGTCNLDSTGPIEDVRIFNRAINLDEVKALYQSASIVVDDGDDDHSDHSDHHDH